MSYIELEQTPIHRLLAGEPEPWLEKHRDFVGLESSALNVRVGVPPTCQSIQIKEYNSIFYYQKKQRKIKK